VKDILRGLVMQQAEGVAAAAAAASAATAANLR